jgi:hypothetical protein
LLSSHSLLLAKNGQLLELNPEQLFSGEEHLVEIHRLVQEGIDQKIVRPFNSEVFNANSASAAFQKFALKMYMQKSL